ncbi:MAG TPA: TVP38/TMEM64 family protein [Clostridiales bacterium]|nr:TVP38/TMEM64 family protein [Clostridiales bacterium]
MSEINTNMAGATRSYLKRRRIFTAVSLGVAFLLFSGLAFFIYRVFIRQISSPEEFKAYIETFGWKGRFVFLGLQCLQIVVAFIPGEIIEVGAGYAFGPVEGTLLCMAGIALASSFVFILTRKWGIKLVETFISREKINELRFIKSERKLKRTIFLLFFIPGTPKDLFTYFVGLTRIKLHEFLAISIIARIPSVVSSTIGGHIISSQNYLQAVILFAVTGVVSLIGMMVFSYISKTRRAAHDAIDKKDNN